MKKPNIYILISVIAILAILVSCTAISSTGSLVSDDSKEKKNEKAAGTDTVKEPQEQESKQEKQEEKQVEPPKKIGPTFDYPDHVRGVYVTSHTTGVSRFQDIINLIDQTDLNSVVIDIKDDYGYITFDLPEDHPLKAYSKKIIKDPKELISTLQKHKIYPIARIVVFKDTTLATLHPELSFTENGALWKNGRKEAFVNPFLPKVWEHNVEIAKMAAELGFQEIQFDYVRFPEGFENRDESLNYSMGEYKDKKPTKFFELEARYAEKQKEFTNKKEQATKAIAEAKTKLEQLQQATPIDEEAVKQQKQVFATAENNMKELEKQKPVQPDFSNKERLVQLRVDAVTDFVSYAKKELEPYGVDVAVDIFGYSATLPEAPGIGQNFSRISSNVDVISSMIYPSHWGYSYFGIVKPDLYPYELITEYAKSENDVLNRLGDKKPTSRPWIQDFSAPWLGKGNYKSYGKAEVEAQIKALNEQGINEFLLWNASNKYTANVDYTPLQK